MSARPLLSGSRLPAAWRRQADMRKQQAQAWWKERQPRERLLLQAGAAMAALALAWLLALRPALDTIAKSRELLPRLRADAVQVDALIIEARALQSGQSGAIEPAGLSAALQGSLQRAGLGAAGALAAIAEPSGGPAQQWEITLQNANAARVMEWLAGLPYLLQLQTREVELARANIDGRDRPGNVSGRIVVQLPAKGAP
ncbi:type II secretion system protein GspM [Pollutimonas bauzanensis]|uniref:General secretion pathway protein M n=1 Tax=Pollutimonas bauzanensis TaxID=658167 RepID=A0A1M5NUD9_9BURK|nr:type II secretion system protein GspM [Pollutimonas bauzanensis]SHG93171.1 general secretion pathway protein M [Pollutimonas bauzanensis]